MIDDQDLEAAATQVSDLLDARIGLRAEASLRGRLRRSIRDEVRRRGDDLGAYLATLGQDADMLQGLVNRVTVQESGFFRHPDHFDVLSDHVLTRVDRPVLIWSAGCANGQEAYSLAMLLVERGVRGSVVATDLSTSALARTVAATYTTREVAGISAARRSRFLVQEGERWRFTSEIRSRVTTYRHNLISPPPDQVAGCQVVFCRNVLIYFSAEHTRVLLDRLAESLPAGAFLFLGGAETLWHVPDGFRVVRLGNSFVYQHRESFERSPVPVDRPRGGTVAPTSVRRRTAGASPARPPRGTLHPSGPLRAADVGRDALAQGDTAAAVVAFRKWCFLEPDDPVAALHLGLALEAGGHAASAKRAYDVSRAVLHRLGPEGTEEALGGYAADELVRLLDTKQGTDR
jgi:chemotaxis protein methyltransferase CheR